MKTATFHVTDLDAYLWFNRIEGMAVEEMRDRLLRKSSPNEQMKAGTAWHAVLEDPPDEIDAIEKNGFRFVVECDAEIEVPQVREIRACKEYEVDGVRVKLTGGCDGISGNIVDDHKLTFNPNPENYMTSYQWRSYLDIYNADIFRYRIYHGSMNGNEVTIRDVSTMKMFRYPGMVDDVIDGIRNLLGFVKEYVPGMVRAA